MCAHATRVFAVWPLRSLSARSRSPLLRSPNQRRIWRQLVRVVIACLSISPVRRRGRGLRSVHGKLRRAYRAFITCWQTETGLPLPAGMLPVPYGLALGRGATAGDPTRVFGSRHFETAHFRRARSLAHPHRCSSKPDNGNSSNNSSGGGSTTPNARAPQPRLQRRPAAAATPFAANSPCHRCSSSQ